MYDTHAKEIQAQCRQSPEAFRDVLLFVIATIQTPLERVPADMVDIRNRGRESSALFGMKRQAYTDIDEEYARLHSRIFAEAELNRPLWRERAILDLVRCIHGLNIAKAGFVLQLALGAVGCIDTHNRKRFNLAIMRIRPERGMSAKTMMRHVGAYVALCDTLGGSRYLWDTWCEYVAERRPDAFPGGAEEVSAHHLCAVNPF